MKSSFLKIAHGFLFGIGFCVVFGVFYFYLTEKMTSEALESFSFDPDTIEITKHRKINRNEKLLVLGEVKNISKSKARGVTVNVDLYLGGEFVKQCSDSINGGVPASAIRNFEISCGGGCTTNPVVEHDSYKIYVTGY